MTANRAQARARGSRRRRPLLRSISSLTKPVGSPVDSSEGASEHVAVLRRLLVHLEAEAHVLDVIALATRPTVLRCVYRALNSTNPGSEPRNVEARRQLTTFCNSLHNRVLHQPLPISQMRSWTAFTPHYSEDVAVSIETLHKANPDNATLLEILKAIHPDEWDNLCERVGRKAAENRRPSHSGHSGALAAGHKAPMMRASSKSRAASSAPAMPIMAKVSSFQSLDDSTRNDDGDSRVVQPSDADLETWASDRYQVLSRTVRGVMRYSEALEELARLEGVPDDDVGGLVDSKFEYLVACQIYHGLKTSSDAADREKAAHIDVLRSDYPTLLRIAYVEVPSKNAAIKTSSRSTTAGAPLSPMTDHHGSSISVKAPYVEREFSSVLLGMVPRADGGDGYESRVLYKVKLPGNPIVGEGKPENQNHAIIFTRGEYLQTLDMNQDNYMGESYKMRNLLECFRGRVRIVGFREHIFSESGGAVASFAAANEFVFGTMVQRFLTWPLMVRFHYGHPDVWDKVWALSSAASRRRRRRCTCPRTSSAASTRSCAAATSSTSSTSTAARRATSRSPRPTASSRRSRAATPSKACRATLRAWAHASTSSACSRVYISGTGLFASSAIMYWALYWFALCIAVLAMYEARELRDNADGGCYIDLVDSGAGRYTRSQWFLQLGFILVGALCSSSVRRLGSSAR